MATDPEDPEDPLEPPVWSDLELSLHGPFGGEQNPGSTSGPVRRRWVLSLCDPAAAASGWTEAHLIEDQSGALDPEGAAYFVHSNLCRFGPPDRLRIRLGKEQQKLLPPSSLCFHLRRLMSASGLAEASGGEAEIVLKEEEEEDARGDGDGRGFGAALATFVDSMEGRPWGRAELDGFLFRLRAVETAAFSRMFGGRNPRKGDKSASSKISSSSPPERRRPLPRARMTCRHCREVFTSRVSFGLHQRRHQEEARRRGRMAGEDEEEEEGDGKGEDDSEDFAPFGKRKRKAKRRERPPVDPQERLAKLKEAAATASPAKKARGRSRTRESATEDDAGPAEVEKIKTSTVATVRALLQATERERSKRGKYSKYRPELRDEVAEFALREGAAEACRRYGERHGVTPSTVRNFVRAYQSHPEELKLEVGRRAYQFGADKAMEQLQEQHEDLTRPLIRRFLSHFLRKNPTLPTGPPEGEAGEREALRRDPKRGTAAAFFSEALSEEVGRVASEEGTERAVEAFSESLGFPLREAACRRLKEAYEEKRRMLQQQQQQPAAAHYHGQQQQQQQQLQQMTTTVIVNQSTSTSGQISFQQQQAGERNVQISKSGVGQTQGEQVIVQQQPQQSSSYPQQQQQHHNSYQHLQPLSLTVNVNQTASETGTSQEDTSALMNLSAAAAAAAPAATTTTEEAAAAASSPSCKREAVEDEADSDNVESKPRVSGRVRYASYDPELRGRVGRRAAENGIKRTKEYFAKTEGIDLPESTIRGLRDKYLLAKRGIGKEGKTARKSPRNSKSGGSSRRRGVKAEEEQGEEEKLDFGPRGRPVRLGKYDEVVTKCVLELVESGSARLSSFLVVATAKQVLRRHAPSMLSENGGSVDLTPSWAKSFLKRVRAADKERKQKQAREIQETTVRIT